jgi:MerR family mercuric resistance operon transcriptional regulator
MPALATITVDVLSEKAGVDTSAIEAFEQLGLIARPRRKGGLRLYSPDDVHRLIFIRRAQELGFLLDTIGELLRLASKPSACGDLHEIAERHLADIRRRRSDLERIEKVLAPLVSSCPRKGGVSGCPIVSALSHPDRSA